MDYDKDMNIVHINILILKCKQLFIPLEVEKLLCWQESLGDYQPPKNVTVNNLGMQQGQLSTYIPYTMKVKVFCCLWWASNNQLIGISA